MVNTCTKCGKPAAFDKCLNCISGEQQFRHLQHDPAIATDRRESIQECLTRLERKLGAATLQFQQIIDNDMEQAVPGGEGIRETMVRLHALADDLKRFAERLTAEIGRI